MIKQKYDYSFFYDNYKYRNHSMFRNYYNKLDKEYRYFILVTKDINKLGTTTAYRSNLVIDDILTKLKDMEFQETKIYDKWEVFPEVSEYWYVKLEGFEQITKVYNDKQSHTRKNFDDSLIYMYYCNQEKGAIAARLTKDYVYVSYNSYRMYAYFDRDKIEAYRSIPFSSSIKQEYNSDHKEMVEKVLKKVMRDNTRGFYNDLILSIKNEFRIR